MMVLATTVLSLLLAQSAGPSVQGIVVRAGTSEPLPKAFVELHTDPAGAVVDRATTEEDGRFVFNGVGPGRYRVAVTRRGYVASSRTINAAAGQPIPEVRLAMRATGAISGRVYDAEGQPLGNVRVHALKATYSGAGRALTTVQTATSNDLGEYRLFWLAPGRYYVAATSPQTQAPGLLNATRDVFFAGSNGRLLVSTSTADPALGAFGTGMLSPEPYIPIFFGGTVDEQAATGIDLRESAEFSGANIVMAPVRARHVRGTVLDAISGRPARYASVSAEPSRARAEANRDTGAFDITLVPGLHALNFSSANGSGYATLKITDADLDNFNILVTPDFDISGRVVIEGKPIDTAAIGSLQVSLRRDAPVRDPAISAYSHPLPNGSLTVAAAVGDFRVNVAPILNVDPPRIAATRPPALENAYVKSIRLGNADVLNGGVHLERPTESRLEIVIATDPGALDGRIVAQNEAPTADLTVVLLPDLRRRNDLYQTALTGANGQFRFDRIPPGDYKVFAWEDVDEGAWYDPEFMRARENDGVGVRISEGRTENVLVPLKR